MASIRKRHNRWEVRVRRGNNPTKCKSFTKLTDAKIWAYQTELALERASAGIATAHHFSEKISVVARAY